jgi:hypothetical protein
VSLALDSLLDADRLAACRRNDQVMRRADSYRPAQRAAAGAQAGGLVRRVVIHSVPCFVTGTAGDYHVLRADSQAEVCVAPRQFQAIARAAVLLHTPGAMA